MGCTTSNTLDVLVLTGSLRKDSSNRGLVEALINAPEFKDLGINVHSPNLADIPFFNQDYELEKKIPSSVTNLKKLCSKSQLIIFVTPQYNGSVSPSVKNAYDWLSRPDPENNGQAIIAGKAAASISTSWLSQGQIKDTQTMGQYWKLKYFQKPYYLNLGSKAFNERGQLVLEQEKKKILNWGGQLVQFAQQNR